MPDGHHFAKYNLNIFEVGTDAGKKLRQERVTRCRSKAQLNQSRLATVDPLSRDGGALTQSQDAPRIGQKRPACRGELDGAAGPRKELDIKRVLQHLDLPAQRWLGHIEALGGVSKMKILTHGHKAAKLFEFERQCDSHID